jgi:Ser/Thr protein kinase RdoA (MazF antagonist)
MLKLLPLSPLTRQTLPARLHWIAHLRAHGVCVPDLLPSIPGALCEEAVEGDGAFIAYAYARLPLSPSRQTDWADPTMPRRLGAVMGRMHRLARDYRPPPGLSGMEQWGEAEWFARPATVLHPSQGAIVAAIERLRAQLALWPREEGSYGLIHDDLHTGNVFCLGNDLAILDFDCCHCSWFVADIASALLFRTWIGPAKEEPATLAQAAAFLRELRRGYETEQMFQQEWLAMLLPLAKLREISLYQSFWGALDLAAGEGDALCRYVYESIATERPFLALDFVR